MTSRAGFEIDERQEEDMVRPPLFANASRRVRAPEGGVLNDVMRLGADVVVGETIGRVASPFDDTLTEIKAPCRGAIIGRTTSPVVNLGDALYHIAWGDEHGPTKPAKPVAAFASMTPMARRISDGRT